MNDARRLQPHGRAESALPLFVAAIFFLLLVRRGIDDFDLLTQIRLGLNRRQGDLFAGSESLVYTIAGAPLVHVGWLAQLLFAEVARRLTLSGVLVFHALIFVSSFLIAVGVGRRRLLGIRQLPLVAALTIGMLAALSNSSARPQSLALFCFALIVALLEHRRFLPRHWLTFALLALLWQNLHPTVTLLIPYLVALTAGDIWEAEKDQRREVLIQRGLLIVIVLASTVLTPDSGAIVAISKQNYTVARYWLEIGEWLPPWAPQVRRACEGYWIAVLLSLCMIALLRRAVRGRELTSFILFVVLSSIAARFILFSALLMVPVWCKWIQRLLPDRYFIAFENSAIRHRTALLVAAALVVAYAIRSAPPSYVPEVPQALVAELRKAGPALRIFSYREWAGIVHFEGGNRWQTQIDGRLYLYDYEQWKRDHAAARATISPAELKAIYRPDALLLHRTYHEALISAVRRDPQWREFNQSTTDQGNALLFLPARSPDFDY